MATKKNPITDPDGSKAAARITAERDRRVREKLKNQSTVGSRAAELAAQAGASLTANIPKVASQAVNAATVGVSNVRQAVNDVAQLSGIQGYSHGLASGNLQRHTDIYGGLVIPEVDFNGTIPSDLLNPQIELQATEAQLTQGLETYAGATRAQKLLQAGYKYIEEVGKTKQQFHKAEVSIIKGATESIKTQQAIVGFDRQNVELEIDREKLEQSKEKLKQAQVTTLGMSNETQQLIQLIEVREGLKESQIKSIQSQTQDVIQRYLNGSFNSTI